jgi:hypothetical protein
MNQERFSSNEAMSSNFVLAPSTRCCNAFKRCLFSTLHSVVSVLGVFRVASVTINEFVKAVNNASDKFE